MTKTNIALLVILVPSVLMALLAWNRSRRNRKIVYANLDSAWWHGHFLPDGYLYGATPDDIAQDMVLHAENCCNARPTVLVDHVEDWMRTRGLI